MFGGGIFLYLLFQIPAFNSDKKESDSAISPLRFDVLGFVILLFGMLLVGYFVFRYDGNWIDNDTVIISRQIEIVDKENTPIPSTHAYKLGYGYQVFVYYLSEFIDMSIIDTQTYIMPFIGVFLLIPSIIVFYFTITKDWIVSLIGTLMVLIQPTFIYTIMRGSHAKLDWPLLMIAIVLLVESAKMKNNKGWYVVFFYFVIFAKVAINVFFTSSFIIALAIGLTFGFVLVIISRAEEKFNQNIERQMYVSLTSFVLILVFVLFIYEPARFAIRLLSSLVETMSLFFLNFEFQTNPYSYIGLAWTSQEVYFLMSSYLWLIILFSIIEWLVRGKSILKAGNKLNVWENFDWFLYTGFAFQIGITIIMDLTKAMGYTNMQVRAIPGFVVFAIILLARRVVHIVSKIQNTSKSLRNILFVVFSLVFLVFTVFSLFSVTFEPTFSNRFTLYEHMEIKAVDWMVEKYEDTHIWTGISQRLWSVYMNRNQSDAFSEFKYLHFGTDDSGDFDYAIVSFYDLLMLNRLNLSAEFLQGQQIYDNGLVKILKLEK